ncbi:hypothetical protein TRFO_25363 [Tritrichomonas foetus]|uniref:Protein kinase domain-containing protein n=1 Tax=Tritrichomonas foetus TaxID=1144522 RepID=A0A1J4K531_9EUKA|nr:hypothetical protein TRFO_25363 [Tritrichomonas foetus]|eukprot:OHT06553.1 hypothetical protein TRFO_25363 [Tritrichomonas foetus]
MKKENIVPLSNDLNGTLYIKKDNFQVFYEYLSKDFPKCQEILDKYEKYMIDKALICKQFGKVNFFTFTWKEVYPYDGKFFVPTNIELLYSVPEYFMKRERKINGNEILYISEFVNHLFLFFQCYDIPIKSIPLSSLYIDQFTGAIKINLLTLSLHSKRQNINYEDIFCAFLFDLLDFKRQIDQKLEVNSETSKHPKIESKVNICIFSHVYQQETNIQVDSIQKIRNFIGNIHSKEYKQYKIYKKSILEYVSSMSNQCFSSYQPLKPNSYFLLLHCIINEKREVSPSFIINGLKIYWKQCNNSKIQYSNVFDTFIQFLLEKGYLSDQNGDIDRCLSIILEQKKHFLLRYLTSLIMDNIHCQFQDQIIMKKDPSWHLIYQGDAKYLISNSNNEIFFWEKRITKDTSPLFHRKKSTTPKFLFNIITDNHSFEYTSFFPGGDLYNYICKNKYSITTSDKIVFLLEILEALHYVSQEYKGYVSLSDKCFLVNEKKDVYLAKVDFDKRTVLSRTYPENTKYYLHPTSIKCSGYSIDIITPEQICIDHILYFFGVLMFYIVTLIHPMELLNDKDCMSVYNLMRT